MTVSTTFTDELLDFIDSLERKWLDSVPEYTFRELLEVYTGCENAAKRAIKARIKEVKAEENSLSDFRDVQYAGVVSRAHFKHQPELIKWLDEKIANYQKDYERELKKLYFQLHLVDSIGQVELSVSGPNAVTDVMIARAKAVPISSMIKVRRDKKANCIWHEDKNPSMHVYSDSRVYCFPCGKAGDAIDVFQALNRCDFKEAVRQMSI